MDIAAVERSFGELLAALGDLVVARNHGEPAEPARGSTKALARRYRARRRRFDTELDALSGAALSDEDARAVATMRGVLDWLDDFEATAGARASEGGLASEGWAVARARAALYRRFGVAAGALRVGDSTVDRLTVFARLASEPDPTARRKLFEALAPLWRVVDGDGGDASPYRHLVASSAARWRVHGSPIEANAVSLGMATGTIESTLLEVVAAWRTVIGAGRLEPWDYWYAVGGASRRLDRLLPWERLLDVNRRYLGTLGADPDVLGITYDVLPRPGRPTIPVAFAIGMAGWAAEQPASGPWTPRPPWVFATYAEGGLGNLLELLHESGHALHAAAVRTRPAFLESTLEDAGFVEGMADVLGWDAAEPAWQRAWLGEAAEPREAVLDRYGAVMLDICWALFEVELHRHPDRRPNDVWTEIATDRLGVEPHPEWSWWALRGQLIDLPGYMANYAFSAIVAAAVRARIIEVRGPWWDGDPGWYQYMAEGLLRAGASRTPAELLEAFLGGRLTTEPLLADLRRGT
jgi:Peptidase family M3